jgi:hypothetical protein
LPDGTYTSSKHPAWSSAAGELTLSFTYLPSGPAVAQQPLHAWFFFSSFCLPALNNSILLLYLLPLSCTLFLIDRCFQQCWTIISIPDQKPVSLENNMQ